MERAVERGPDWVGVPVIATVARLLCRELTLQNEYLRLENLQGWYGLGLSRAGVSVSGGGFRGG